MLFAQLPSYFFIGAGILFRCLEAMRPRRAVLELTEDAVGLVRERILSGIYPSWVQEAQAPRHERENCHQNCVSVSTENPRPQL